MSTEPAITIEKNGEIIGAAFPHFSFRIVEVPFHDPDKDGMVCGHTHALKFEPSNSGPFAGVEKCTWGMGIGLTGSIPFLRERLKMIVREYNANHRMASLANKIMPKVDFLMHPPA